MFRIKNVRGATVGKNSKIASESYQNKPILPLKKNDGDKKKTDHNALQNLGRKIQSRKMEARPLNHRPLPKPSKLNTSNKNVNLLSQDNDGLDKKNRKKQGFHMQNFQPPQINKKLIQEKMRRSRLIQRQREDQPHHFEDNKSSNVDNFESSQLISNEKVELEQQERKVLNFFNREEENLRLQKQGNERMKREKIQAEEKRIKEQQKQKQKQRQKQKQKQKQRQKQKQKQKKRKIKQREQQEQRKREEQAQQQIEKIKRRRKQRQREQSLRKQQEGQRMKKREQIEENLSRHSGMIYSNDPLAHFQLSDAVIDAQIHKLIKTFFNHFPSGAAIEAKKGELERINMSYQMIQNDPANSRLAQGLKNYRIQLLNQIGELIMEDQKKGFSHPDFSLVEGDPRDSQRAGVKLTRGIPKDKVDKFMEKTICSETQDCPICLEEIEKGQGCSKLRCGHIFHESCSEDWLDLTANCPSCRKNLKFGD